MDELARFLDEALPLLVAFVGGLLVGLDLGAARERRRGTKDDNRPKRGNGW